ncbi:MAG: TdeIII family type II restriction endonuclease [Candidatus Heimdallarchaeaceae archaeon]
MTLSEEEIIRITKDTVIEAIAHYTKNKKKISFHVMNLVMPRERFVHSMVHGMLTSFGKTLWEKLARNFAKENGFEVINKKLLKPKLENDEITIRIKEIKESRYNNKEYAGFKVKEDLRSLCYKIYPQPLSKQDLIKPKDGRGVDTWLKKNGINYIFDIKTVRPNIKNFPGFLEQILRWYYYFYSQIRNEDIYAKIVFPFNPFDVDFWEKTINQGRPLDPETDALVENEFWDFITGYENTFNFIKDAFKQIREEKLVTKYIEDLFERIEIKYELK